MKNKRGLKYYAMILGVSTLALIIYLGILLFSTEEELTGQAIAPLLIIPITFTTLVFVFDQLLDRVLPKKYRRVQSGPTEFDLFLVEVNQIVGNDLDLSLEDARKLRENEKFQKVLTQIFTIKKHGENNELSWNYLQKKFKKDTVESTAIDAVISAVKK